MPNVRIEIALRKPLESPLFQHVLLAEFISCDQKIFLKLKHPEIAGIPNSGEGGSTMLKTTNKLVPEVRERAVCQALSQAVLTAMPEFASLKMLLR